jgi:ABC-type nitrate/sulfonate/bicarbonate transport system substrate-binding protein
MHKIDLTYVGSGIHEELVAHVADQEGYFEDEGVHVALRDGAVWKTERVRAGATIGLGRAMLSRLSDGIEWQVLAANTHSPLFWFMGGKGIKSMEELRGRRLAVHGARTAPGVFARIVLRKHGLDPDRDVECVERIPGDYQMDLRRLREGTIDAAYVGSTLGPEQVAREEGFTLLSWVGDHFRVPTVGIAVDPARVRLDDPALQALVQANKRALRTIAEQPDLAIKHVASMLNRLTGAEAQQYYERYIRPHYTADGRVDAELARQAVAAVAHELGVPVGGAAQMYLPAL